MSNRFFFISLGFFFLWLVLIFIWSFLWLGFTFTRFFGFDFSHIYNVCLFSLLFFFNVFLILLFDVFFFELFVLFIFLFWLIIGFCSSVSLGQGLYLCFNYLNGGNISFSLNFLDKLRFLFFSNSIFSENLSFFLTISKITHLITH